MGKPSYQLACHVKWGDKWPGWYCNTRKKVDVEDPDLHKAVTQLRRRQEGSGEEEEEGKSGGRRGPDARRRVNEGFRDDFGGDDDGSDDDEQGGEGEGEAGGRLQEDRGRRKVMHGRQ